MAEFFREEKNGAFFSTYVFARKYGRARGQIYVFKAGPKGKKRKTFIKLRFSPYFFFSDCTALGDMFFGANRR